MGSHGDALRPSYAYHEGNDSVGDEFVDEVRVEPDTLRVGGVVTAT